MFDSSARHLVDAANDAARRLGQLPGAAHLLLAGVRMSDLAASQVLRSFGLTGANILAAMTAATRSDRAHQFETQSRSAAHVVQFASTSWPGELSAQCLLWAVVVGDDPVVAYVLDDCGVDQREVGEALSLIVSMESAAGRRHVKRDQDPLPAADTVSGPPPARMTPQVRQVPRVTPVPRADPVIAGPPALDEALTSFVTDFTQIARDGGFDALTGRDAELDRLMGVLCRRSKNNPVLVGPPGVGKTAIVEGLAQRITTGDVPAPLLGKRILSVDVASLRAGTTLRGDLEQRMKALLGYVARCGDVLVFVDEMHLMVAAGSAVTEALKPVLARGELCMIGASTEEEYRRYVLTDAALERRFAPVQVAAASAQQTVEILARLAPTLGAHHHVTYTPAALAAAVELSVRYLPGRHLPDKAIDALDEAGAVAAAHRARLAAPLRERYHARHQARLALQAAQASEDFEACPGLAARVQAAELALHEVVLAQMADVATTTATGTPPWADITVVDDVSVAHVISDWAGVVLTGGDHDERLRCLDTVLAADVVGQSHAVTAVVAAMRRRGAGFDAARPVSFLFAGPTGVGKTQLALALARHGFGDSNALIRFDMSEFGESFAVSRLLGAPPGYIGHDGGGELVEAIRRRPQGVLLLDEIDKAHPHIFDALLGLLDHGRLSDGQGRVVDASHLVVIMTSNVGVGAPGPRAGFSSTQRDADQRRAHADTVRAVAALFRPEFINRLDDIITFAPLTSVALRQMVDAFVREVASQLGARGSQLTVTAAARDALVEAGYNPLYGARELRRVVQTHLADPLADAVLAAGCHPASHLLVDVADSHAPQLLSISVAEVAPAPLSHQLSAAQ